MRKAALLVVLSSFFASLLAPGGPAWAADRQKSSGDLPGEKEFLKGCKKLPAGKRIIKLSLKPDSEVADLIGWMSTISCTPFLFSGPSLQGKKVTVLSPELLTPEEAYKLFIGALAAVDLAVEPVSSGGRAGSVIRIVTKPSR
jgi:hypothetical protein